MLRDSTEDEEEVAGVGDRQREGHGRQGGRRRRDPDAVASSVAARKETDGR